MLSEADPITNLEGKARNTIAFIISLESETCTFKILRESYAYYCKNFYPRHLVISDKT